MGKLKHEKCISTYSHVFFWVKESNLKNESTYLSPSHDTSLNDDLSIANNDPPPRLVPVRTIVWLGKYISAIWRNRFLIKNISKTVQILVTWCKIQCLSNAIRSNSINLQTLWSPVRGDYIEPIWKSCCYFILRNATKS